MNCLKYSWGLEREVIIRKQREKARKEGRKGKKKGRKRRKEKERTPLTPEFREVIISELINANIES